MQIANDLRYAVRTLAKAPGFALVSVAALAVGVGANVAVFGFANAVLLRPVDAAEPQRLVRAYASGSDPLASVVDYADYLQYRDRNQSLTNLAAFHWGGLRPVRAAGIAEQIHVMPVTGNYFETLGVNAALGRVIQPGDDHAGAPGVALLSDVCWRRRFAADPGVIGRTFTINKTSFTVIGVTPASFTGTAYPVIPQIYVPWNGPAEFGAAKSGHLIGRLRDGVTVPNAQADLSRIAGQLSAEHGCPVTVEVFPATMTFPGFARTLGTVAALFLAVVALVLLLACDNIALLLLAQSYARRRELGIRLALGATRGQLARQLLAQCLLLSLAGGLGAAAFAMVAARFLTQIYLPTPMPIALLFDFDWRVAAFAVLVSLATTVLFGLGPALHASRADAASLVQEGAYAGGAGGRRTRAGLIVAQVALSTVLLATAGTLVRGLMQLRESAYGFTAERVLMATVRLPAGEYSAERGLALYARLLGRLEQTPGIISVTLADNVPLTNNTPLGLASMQRESTGGSAQAADAQPLHINRVSPGHFRTLGIALLAGRDFDARDTAGAPAVGIVNETLARRFWPDEPAIGKRLRPPGGSWIEVVGVAGDSRYESLGESPMALLYRPLSQQYFPTGTFLIKTASDPRVAAALVRAAVSDVDPTLLAYSLNSLEDRIGLNLLANRALAMVAGALGLGALALGAFGTYGILAVLAQQRRKEMGIRMALGAQRRDVVRLFTGQGMKWAGIGLALGAAGALAAAQILQRFLSGVAAFDALALGATALLLLSTVYAACFVPARRASRASPLDSLREE